MSELSGKTPEELETELSGVIFRDIDCPETAAEIAAPFFRFKPLSFSHKR